MLSAVLETLLFSLIITAKVAFVTCELNDRANLLTIVLTTSAGLIILFSWLVFAPRRTRLSVILFTDCVATVLLLADALFYRYNHNVITLPMMHQVGQVGAVSSSVLELFKKRDLWIVADLILLVFLRFFSRDTTNAKTRAVKRVVYAMASASICCAVIWLVFLDVTQAYGRDRVFRIYANSLFLRNFGILAYHAADVILEDQVLPVSLEEVQQWDAIHKGVAGGSLCGVGKGKNLIIIEMEALQQFVIGSKVDGQEVTPNLNALADSSLYFDNCFSQIAEGNTSDAEFLALTSTYATKKGCVFIDKWRNSFTALPRVLKGAGYESAAFHAFNPDYYNRDKMFVSLGFDRFFCNQDYLVPSEDVVGLGLSDEQMFEQTFDKILTLPSPFFCFIISLSGHHPYELPPRLRDLKVGAGEYSTLFQQYLQSQHYADRQLGRFVRRLADSGVLENTILVVYGDHFAPELRPEEIFRLQRRSGKPGVYEVAELCRIPVMIRLPNGEQHGVCHRTGGQIDLYPTIANIMGLDKSKILFFGNDLLNVTQGAAGFRHYIPIDSFVSEELFYIASDDGDFYSGSCYRRADGKLVNVGECFQGYRRLKHEMEMSDFILQSDSIASVLAR
jgi:lipoteichoic acid synthase